MKTRLSELLNALNISLPTAVYALNDAVSASKGKKYTLNTVMSAEETHVLTEYARNFSGTNKEPKGRINRKNAKKGKGKPAHFNTSKSMPFTSKRSFNSCLTFFNSELKDTATFAAIKEEMDRVFGGDVKLRSKDLFRTASSNSMIVNYKYYYYSLNGHKTLVADTCVATWLACLFSEAVNRGLMSKIDYHLFFKNHLWRYIESIKSKGKSKPAKKRPWVSIVSVPFGGMNRR